jgi:hypothetical protein
VNQEGVADEAVKAAEELVKIVDNEISQERARKTSLEQRGVFVITSSGTLTSLLLAVAVLGARGKDYTIPDHVLWTLFVAAIAFAVAAGFALRINTPVASPVASTDDLRENLNASGPAWSSSVVDVQKATATWKIDTLQELREGNNSKAQLVQAALGAELVAVVAVAVAVGLSII